MAQGLLDQPDDMMTAPISFMLPQGSRAHHRGTAPPGAPNGREMARTSGAEIRAGGKP
jgi:hypothetical protein